MCMDATVHVYTSKCIWSSRHDCGPTYKALSGVLRVATAHAHLQEGDDANVKSMENASAQLAAKLPAHMKCLVCRAKGERLSTGSYRTRNENEYLQDSVPEN